MSNITNSVANTAGFIASAWANRALDVLRANIVLAKLVMKDTDVEPGWRGQTLNVGYPGTFTASDKAADGTATVQTPSNGATVAITLNKHKYVDFIVEDVARAQASSELMDRYVQPSVVALAEQVESDLFALYSSAGQATIGTTGTDLAASLLRTAKKTMTDRKLPLAPRYGVISTKDEIALLGDSTLATYFAYSRSQGVSDGSIGNLYGFELYPSQLVPVVAGTPASTKNLFFGKDALLLASRPFMEPPQDSGVKSSVIVDDVSGLAIRVMYQYSMGDRGTRIGFDILYGVKILRDAALQVVLS